LESVIKKSEIAGSERTAKVYHFGLPFSLNIAVGLSTKVSFFIDGSRCATSMSDADDRELCVLSILRMESSASTKRIIELASTPEFERTCRDCKSGVEVYETAMKLYRLGRITRKAGEGGFMWTLSLISKGQ